MFYRIPNHHSAARAALETNIKARKVSVRDGGEVEVRGDLEKAIRILKKKLAREGFFREMKKRKHYEKPSVRRRKKSQEAQKRRKKVERREAVI